MLDKKLPEEAGAVADQHGNHGPKDGHRDNHGQVPREDESDGRSGKNSWLIAIGQLLDALKLAVKLYLAIELIGHMKTAKSLVAQLMELVF